MAKERLNIALTPAGMTLLDRLAERLGLKRTNVLEIAVRRMAEAEGLPPETPAPKRKPRKVTGK